MYKPVLPPRARLANHLLFAYLIINALVIAFVAISNPFFILFLLIQAAIAAGVFFQAARRIPRSDGCFVYRLGPVTAWRATDRGSGLCAAPMAGFLYKKQLVCSGKRWGRRGERGRVTEFNRE